MVQSIVELLLEVVGIIFAHLDPFLSLAFFPDTLSHSSVRENVDSLISLFAINPVSNIGSSISPNVDSETMFLVVSVASMIHSSI